MIYGDAPLPFALTKAAVLKTYGFCFSGANAHRSGAETLKGTFTLNQTALLALPGTEGLPGWYTRDGVKGIVTAFNATVKGSTGSNEPLSLSHVVGFSIVGRDLNETQSLVDAPGFGNLFLYYAGATYAGSIVANGGSYGTDLAPLFGRIYAAAELPACEPQENERELGLGQVLGLTVPG